MNLVSDLLLPALNVANLDLKVPKSFRLTPARRILSTRDNPEMAFLVYQFVAWSETPQGERFWVGVVNRRYLPPEGRTWIEWMCMLRSYQLRRKRERRAR